MFSTIHPFLQLTTFWLWGEKMFSPPVCIQPVPAVTPVSTIGVLRLSKVVKHPAQGSSPWLQKFSFWGLEHSHTPHRVIPGQPQVCRRLENEAQLSLQVPREFSWRINSCPVLAKHRPLQLCIHPFPNLQTFICPHKSHVSETKPQPEPKKLLQSKG